MFNIDKRGLMSQITLALIPSFKEEDNQEDSVTYYFNVILDVVVGAMNSKFRNIDDAIEEQFDLLEKDVRLYLMAEVIRELLIDIKRQFIAAGFDQRLKYKLVTRQVGRTKFYGLAMDLDATAEAIAWKPEAVEEETIAEAVSEEPTLEQLSQIYNW